MSVKQEHSASSVALRTRWFVAVNAIGIALYLFAASFGWVERELADIPGASGGGAVVWFLFAVPVLLVFFLANLGAFCYSCIRRYRTGAWPISMLAWSVLIIWGLAIWLDFSRHGV
jgi:hypothetical protein